MPRINNKNKSLIAGLLLGLGLVSPNLQALEVDAQVEVGQNTNPLELSDQFSPDSSSFSDVKLRLRQELAKDLRVSGRIQQQNFFEEGDADTTSLSARMDYKISSTLAQREITYRFDVEYNDVDRTYVSKNLGRIGETLNGTLIGDRYDAEWLDYRVRMDIDLSERLRLDLNLNARTKAYKDFSELGLSNLDYSQWLFEPEIRFTASDSSLLTASLLYGNRDFDDRNGRDLISGAFIPDTQLDYDYIGSEIGWRFRPDEKQQYRLVYTYEKREDSVSGYFDASDNVLRMSYRNQISDNQYLELGLRYRDFSYDNSLDQGTIETEEAILSKNGFILSAEYARQIMPITSGEAWWLIGIGHEDFDSTDSAYAYAKSLFHLGLRYEY